MYKKYLKNYMALKINFKKLQYHMVSVIFICVMLLFNISCNGPAKYPQDAKFKDFLFSDNTHAVGEQRSPKTINFYVDISESNKGFVQVNNSNFLKSIRDLCSIIDPDVKTNFYAFGDHIKFIGNDIRHALNYFQNPHSYNNSETRFDLLLKNLTLKKINEEVNLVFTDGIHSENKQTQNTYVELANRIRKFVKVGNLFGLIGNKGYFDGIYYPEVKAKSFPYNGIRPFYCFVFATRQYIDFIKTHLIENWEKYFILYPASLDCIKADMDNSNVGIDESMVKENTFIIQNLNSVDTILIPITIDSDDFKFWDFNTVSSSMEVKRTDIFYGSEKDSFIVLDSSKIVKHQLVTKESSKVKLTIDFKFNPIEYDGMAVYRLIITPKVPDWINEWSTDYDGTPQNVTKTYALKSFTKNLLKITNDNQFTFLSLYFVI